MGLIEVRKDFFIPDRALRFGAASTDRLTITAAASINDLNPYTWIMWVRPRAFTDLGRLVDKNPKLLRMNGTTEGSGLIRNEVPRATTTMVYQYYYPWSLSLWEWHWIAATYDSAGSAGQIGTVYHGNIHNDFIWGLADPVGGQVDGSGTTNVDNAANLCLGNRNAGDRGCSIDVAFFSMWNRKLNPAELLQQFRNPQLDNGCVVFMQVGEYGTGTQFDLSGNANNGAVTGATPIEGPAATAYMWPDHEDGIPIPGWNPLIGGQRRRLIGAY